MNKSFADFPLKPLGYVAGKIDITKNTLNP